MVAAPGVKDTTSTFSEATERVQRVHRRALWRPGNVPVCAEIYDLISIARSCGIMPGLQGALARTHPPASGGAAAIVGVSTRGTSVWLGVEGPCERGGAEG